MNGSVRVFCMQAIGEDNPPLSPLIKGNPPPSPLNLRGDERGVKVTVTKPLPTGRQAMNGGATQAFLILSLILVSILVTAPTENLSQNLTQSSSFCNKD
jgi:hypothetical protein